MPSELEIKITATIDELRRAIDEATGKVGDGARTMEQQAGRISSAFERIRESVSSNLRSIGEVALGVFGGLSLEGALESLKDELTEITLGGFEWGNELRDTALATGITTTELQKLQYAATISGQDLNRLQFIVNHLSQQMLQLANSDAPELRAAFQTLGLDPSTFADAYDALQKIGDRVREIGNLSLEQRGALVTIGGRGISELLPAITNLRELGQEAERTNYILSVEQVNALDEANESVNRLRAQWESLKHTLATLSAAPVKALADVMARMPIGAGHAMAVMPELVERRARFDEAAEGWVAEMRRRAQAAQGPTAAPLTKNALQREIDDFIATQRLETIAAGNTAEARIEMAQRVHDYLVSREQDAAKVGMDLHKQILQATIEVAQAREAAAKQAAEAEKRGIQDLERTISERFREHVRIAQEEARAVAEWDRKAEEDRRQSLAQTVRDWDTHLKEMQAEGERFQRQIGSIFEPVANAFIDSFRGVIQGTQSVSRAFANMGQSILLEFAGSGLRSALLGGAEDSFWSRIFGEQGKGGGLVGAGVHLLGLDALFGGAGQTVQTAALTANTAAVNANTAALLGKGAATAIGGGGNISGVLGGAGNILGGGGGAQSAAGNVAGALGSPEASSAVSSLFGQGFSNTVSQVTDLFGQGFTNISGLLTNIFGSIFSGLGPLLSTGGAGILSIFGFEHGGIVPSAAGGMVTDGATLALLHPREMVLPADLRERVTRGFPLASELRIPGAPGIPGVEQVRERMSPAALAAGGGEVRAGDVSVNVSISAIDARSLAGRMSEIKDAIGDAVSDAIRDGHRGLAELLRKRG